jgi:chaperonin GroES
MAFVRRPAVADDAALGGVHARAGCAARHAALVGAPDAARQEISWSSQFMTITPLHDRLIVRRLDETPDSAGGVIVIPDSAKEKPQYGMVLAAGPGRFGKDGKRLPLDVRAGDLILFGKYSGQEVTLDSVEYLIMKEDDVLAVQERQE